MSRAETLLCSRWTTVWIEGVHLALCSTPLFFLTSDTCVYASVSPAFHLCSALKREAPVGRVSAVTVSGRSNGSHRGAAFQTFCSRCVLKSQRRVGCLGRWEWFCCWVARRANLKAETHFHDTTRTRTSYTDLMPFCYWCVWDGMECVNLWPRLHCCVFENQDWSVTPERRFCLLRFWMSWVLFNVPFYLTSFGWLCLWRSSWFTHHWEFIIDKLS